MKLSVVIPVHNQARFVGEAIRSVLREEIAGSEILVVDDGSTDDCLGAIEGHPVRYLSMPERRGVASARNAGARAARGEYLAFLDADDRIVAGGLGWRLAFLEANPRKRAVAGILARVIDEAGAPAGGFRFPWVNAVPGAEITREWARSQPGIQTAAWSILFRSDYFLELGGFNEDLKFDPDTDLLLRSLDLESLPFFAKGTVEYRVHAGNHTRVQGEAFRQSRSVLAETWLANLAGRAR